jgi:hypothetical protein
VFAHQLLGGFSLGQFVPTKIRLWIQSYTPAG